MQYHLPLQLFMMISTFQFGVIYAMEPRSLKSLCAEKIAQEVNDIHSEILSSLPDDLMAQIESHILSKQGNAWGALITAAAINSAETKYRIEQKFPRIKESHTSDYNRAIWNAFAHKMNSPDIDIQKELLIFAARYNAYEVAKQIFCNNKNDIVFDNEPGCAYYQDSTADKHKLMNINPRLFRLRAEYEWGNPLLEAIRHEGDDKLVAFLLEKGLDPNVVSFNTAKANSHWQGGYWNKWGHWKPYCILCEYNMSPLILAIRKGKNNVVRLLLDNGANVQQRARYFEEYKDQQNPGKETTAFMTAIERKNSEAFMMLLEHSKDIKYALNASIHYLSIPALKIILKKEKNIDYREAMSLLEAYEARWGKKEQKSYYKREMVTNFINHYRKQIFNKKICCISNAFDIEFDPEDQSWSPESLKRKCLKVVLQGLIDKTIPLKGLDTLPADLPKEALALVVPANIESINGVVVSAVAQGHQTLAIDLVNHFFHNDSNFNHLRHLPYLDFTDFENVRKLLHRAIRYNVSEVVKTILKKDLSQPEGEKYFTVDFLRDAVLFCDEKLLEMLLEHYKSQNGEVNWYYREHVLNFAIKEGRNDLIPLLTQYMPNNKADKYHYRRECLDFAIKTNPTSETIKILLPYVPIQDAIVCSMHNECYDMFKSLTDKVILNYKNALEDMRYYHCGPDRSGITKLCRLRIAEDAIVNSPKFIKATGRRSRTYGLSKPKKTNPSLVVTRFSKPIVTLR